MAKRWWVKEDQEHWHEEHRFDSEWEIRNEKREMRNENENLMNLNKWEDNI